MTSNLKNGRLLPPASLVAAFRRHQQLSREIDRIQAQINDPNRILTYTNKAGYDAWKTSATHTLTLFKCEQKQLAEWIVKTVPSLLKEAHAILIDVHENEVELSTDELATVAKLAPFSKEIL